MKKASVKLFQESYFDVSMANMLGLSGMYITYQSGEFHQLWATPHNILSSSLTIIWSILLLAFPIWQYRKMCAMARFQETRLVDSDYDSKVYYEVFCEGMNTYNIKTYLYNFYFVIQRLVIALTLIVLREMPLLQFSIFIFISIYRL